MKHLLSILFAAVMSMTVAASLKAEVPVSQDRFVEVVGTAERYVEPDTLCLTISITEKILKGDPIPLYDLEKMMVSQLKGIGINVNECLEYSDWANNYKKYLTKYVTKKNYLHMCCHYRLTVTDAGVAGTVKAMLESGGLCIVTLSAVKYSDIEQLRSELKREAMEKAMVRAQEVAQLANAELGEITSVVDEEPCFNELEQKSDAPSDWANLEFDGAHVKYSVRVRYSLN